jgi:hypothetical protein
MKIRKGFVSNSSSSSFVCDICGEECSGWDMGLTEAGMHECVNGHTVCDEHIKEMGVKYNDMSFNEKKAYCLEIVDYESIKNIINKIDDEDDLDDLYENDIEGDNRYNMPASQCPCCLLVNITDKQLLKFLLFDKGVCREDVEDEIRTRFSDYEEMRKAIES